MTNANQTYQQHAPKSALKPILFGAGIALALIILFVSGVNDPNPDWGKYWMIRPILVVTFAGATGGAVYHFLDKQNFTGLNKLLSILVSFVIYVFGLWIGSIIGLAGTLWN